MGNLFKFAEEYTPLLAPADKQALSTFVWGGASEGRKILRTVGTSFEIEKKDLNMYLFYQNDMKACYHCTLRIFSCGFRLINRFDTKKV